MRQGQMAFYILVFFSWLVPCFGQQIRLEATKDNSIVLVENETGVNAGSAPRIRIKGNQHLVAMDFDFDRIKGRVVSSAVLVCGRVDNMIEGVTLSTIMTPWTEYESNALTSGIKNNTGWGWDWGRFPAITGGNSNSLLCQAKSILKDNYYYWQIEPDLLHANAIGLAHGITIHEFDCDYSRNPQIFAREQSNKKPYLLVTIDGKETVPETASELEVVGSDLENLRLILRAPENGFAYEVQVNGKTLPRWNIPFVKLGQMQSIPIRDISLRDGTKVNITVTTVNRINEKSKPISISAMLPNLKLPDFPQVDTVEAAQQKYSNIAVIPVSDKYDINGKPVGDLPDDYLYRNEVFDGEKISLTAAKGEVVGYQILLKGTGKVNVKCLLPGIETDTFKALYVESANGKIPDPLVPFDELNLSEKHATPVVVDVYVPFDATEGIRSGVLNIPGVADIPIELKVYGFAIGRKASFLCEMNSYGLPDKVVDFYKLQQVAYDHRTHCNILHYSHSTAASGSRKCNLDMLMENGTRMDQRRYNDIKPDAIRAYWDDFTKAFGPFLSGNYFEKGHRGPIPAPGFYLTFHESWPLNVRSFFNGNPDAYEAFRDTPEYSQTFVNILKDFISHAQTQGWNDCGFQVYLNNKGSLTDPAKAPWILDEPTEYWDYRALAYYGDLVTKSKNDNCPVNIQYRIDISRPQYDRGQLEAKSNLWVVSSSAMHQFPRIVADRAERTGEDIWVYGTSNRVEDSNRQIHGWVLWSYRHGAKGVVPWQTVDKSGKALLKADQLGIFIFDKDKQGQTVIRHSMRLKTYRRAQQDIEYLELLRKKKRLSRKQLYRFIDHYLDLSGDVLKTSSDDAGTAKYVQISPESFRRLRLATAIILEQ